MKIGNKGFAISTMLYGMLTLIVLVLSLLLALLRTTYNKEIKLQEDVTTYTNKCIAKQVALETCYTNQYDDGCSEEYETYLNCLGLKSQAQSDKTVTLASKISSALKNGNYDSSRKVFKGATANNYLQFNGTTLRVISLETNGSIKVIFDDFSRQEKFDSTTTTNAATGNSRFQNSTIYNSLTRKYNDLDYKSLFVEGNYYVGSTYDTYKIKQTLDRAASEKSKDKIGLVSILDVYEASSNASCATYMKGTDEADITTGRTACTENNWLVSISSTPSWTTTTIANGGVLNQSLTYKNTATKINATSHTSNGSLPLVMFLKNNILVEDNGADGSSSKPYIVVLK